MWQVTLVYKLDKDITVHVPNFDMLFLLHAQKLQNVQKLKWRRRF